MSDSPVYSGQDPTQVPAGQTFVPPVENVVPPVQVAEEPALQTQAEVAPAIPVVPQEQPPLPPLDTTPPVPPTAPLETPPPAPPTEPQSQQAPPAEPMEQAYQRPQPEEVLLEWQAPSRPFKKRNRQYYTTIGIIVLLISMILFFAGQFLPIAVVIAVAFLAYVLSAIPPEVVINRVTTYGVRADDTLYFWEELGRYWFADKYHQRLVHIETIRFPNQITLVLADQDEEELRSLLGEVLLNEKPALTSFDRAAQWLQEKIPLDTEA